MAVRPSRAAHHPCKLLFGHKQRTLAGTATAKCACIISGLNDSTSALLSPKLRSCTILFTQSIHLSFLLRLVLEVLRNKKKALIILLDCQQFFFHRKGHTAQYSQRTSLTYNGTTELPSRTEGLREPKKKKMLTSCIIFCFRAANQQNQEVTAHNHIHTEHLPQSQALWRGR